MTQEEVLNTVYLVLGNPSVEDLPNNIVNHFIDQWEIIYPLDTESCMLTYKVVVSCVNYIITKLTNEGVTAGYSRSEKEGNVSIAEDFGDTSPIDVWNDWLSSFLKSPTDFLPCLASVSGFTSSAMPIITGLQRDKYINVLGNPNNISGGGRIGSLWNNSANQNLDSFVRGDQGFYRGRRR